MCCISLLLLLSHCFFNNKTIIFCCGRERNPSKNKRSVKRIETQGKDECVVDNINNYNIQYLLLLGKI